MQRPIRTNKSDDPVILKVPISTDPASANRNALLVQQTTATRERLMAAGPQRTTANNNPPPVPGTQRPPSTISNGGGTLRLSGGVPPPKAPRPSDMAGPAQEMLLPGQRMALHQPIVNTTGRLPRPNTESPPPLPRRQSVRGASFGAEEQAPVIPPKSLVHRTASLPEEIAPPRPPKPGQAAPGSPSAPAQPATPPVVMRNAKPAHLSVTPGNFNSVMAAAGPHSPLPSSNNDIAPPRPASKAPPPPPSAASAVSQPTSNEFKPPRPTSMAPAPPTQPPSAQTPLGTSPVGTSPAPSALPSLSFLDGPLAQLDEYMNMDPINAPAPYSDAGEDIYGTSDDVHQTEEQKQIIEEYYMSRAEIYVDSKSGQQFFIDPAVFAAPAAAEAEPEALAEVDETADADAAASAAPPAPPSFTAPPPPPPPMMAMPEFTPLVLPPPGERREIAPAVPDARDSLLSAIRGHTGQLKKVEPAPQLQRQNTASANSMAESLAKIVARYDALGDSDDDDEVEEVNDDDWD
ncbi:hypothetical protein, variant [Capsaspora owczarzaki ATCC 30864]|nr:hypothetical protein, variant [Capsaspora owczarzaki ATCC 30864]